MLSRSTIVILACLLLAAGGSGRLPGGLATLGLSAGVAALLGVLALGLADRRKRQHWDALLHVRTARGILDELEVVRQHRRTLREFGRLLCESPAHSYRRQARRRASPMVGQGFSSH